MAGLRAQGKLLRIIVHCEQRCLAEEAVGAEIPTKRHSPGKLCLCWKHPTQAQVSNRMRPVLRGQEQVSLHDSRGGRGKPCILWSLAATAADVPGTALSCKDLAWRAPQLPYYCWLIGNQVRHSGNTVVSRHKAKSLNNGMDCKGNPGLGTKLTLS